MMRAATRHPATPRSGRGRLAASRARAARAALERCLLCDHRCGVNRLAGMKGICHAGASARVFSAQTEVSDEVEIMPAFAIALSGCDLRCDFCITGRESWDAKAGEPLDVREVAAKAERALENGARTVMILGGEPTIFLPDALELASLLPDSTPLIWKTNGHGSSEARALLEGIFDVWVVDYKFGNDTCAKRLARVDNYSQTVRENLLWAAGRTDLIVRHLLMPGHLECCWEPVANWIARNIPAAKVSLRTGFWPAWQSRRHPELATTCPPADADRAAEIAEQLSLHLIP